MVDRKIKPEPSGSGNKPPGRQAPASESPENEDSPRGRKRARREQDDDDEEDDEADEKPVPMDEDEEDEVEKDGLIRDKDGYVMGSITRIACKNFVTYNHVEFNPGPALNMLIGPNGTGKSTIACAIAIGLGFPPKVLGRSTKLSAFVKTDATDETWIEIELKGRPGKKNLIVRRYIYKDSEKSKFTLDGDEANATAVAEKMKELNVQVSNLCTFLPQDRVASFSAMTHSELLVETQKAAGDRNLSHWHKTLIEHQKQQKSLQSDLDLVAERLKRRETKQAESEKDVRKAEQRIKIEHELAVLAILIQFAAYDDAHGQWLEAKQNKNQANEELKELQAANRPFEESQQALKGIVEHFNSIKDTASTKGRKLEREIKKVQDSLEKVEDETSRTREKYESVKKDEQDRHKVIAQLEKQVAQLETKVSAKLEPVDYAPIQAEITAKSSEKADIVARLTNNQADSEAVNRELRNIVKQEGADANRLAQLNNVKIQREQDTQRWESDTWKGVQWMRQNKDRFKSPVYEPARLNVFAKTQDRHIVNLVEGPISLTAFKTFLFENREDYDLMMREVNDRGLARINGAQIDIGMSLANYPNAMNTEQLNKIGFDCFPIDHLDGPDAVLAWLAKEHNLNKIPLQIRARPLDQRIVDNLPGLKIYYTPEGSFSIKRSQYGARNVQTEQRSLQPAKILLGGLDTSKVAELEKSMATHKAAKDELRRKNADILAIDNDLQNRIEVLDAERQDLIKRKEKMAEPFKLMEKHKVALQSKRSTLEKEKKKPSAETKRKALLDDLRKFSSKRVSLALQHKELAFKLSQVQVSGVAVHLRHLQAESDLRAMSSSALEKDQEIRDKQAELEEIAARTSQLYHKAKRIMEEAGEADRNAEEDVRTEVAAYRDANDLNMEELSARHSASEAQLALTAPIQASVLEAHEKRKKEIAALRKEVEEADEKLENSTTTLNRVRESWLPRLEALISKISNKFKEAFDALGLLGEIQLGKHDDYAQWGIEILVSFRDKEPLKVLTSHRQSGGERALTTVMYLMSLAELAQAPFALVDEINQGMDQRVERNVHNALVKTTCKDDVGQYFLLTPKLLPDLQYHPLMKVLVIQAGTWLPDKLSLADIVKRKLKRKALAGPVEA
ncbi:P-loop containing nucleoside triphosphate hydrolase protein [Leucosporidium creatinivorum]|uniref:Structural maintenance of chromosomes protein 5 n=1 Tax=Leucosporidium creatinivorum TaxID=106004 RepID=A0A1Y2DPE6_9BASI|nr:P-loop containing nucleoside triphosphate hydrolase protein [Leucosporidium creatinivorum]